jgi:hypothetical protein
MRLKVCTTSGHRLTCTGESAQDLARKMEQAETAGKTSSRTPRHLGAVEIQTQGEPAAGGRVPSTTAGVYR